MHDLASCPFCADNLIQSEITLVNEHCIFLRQVQPILKGSGLIIPKQHRETVFDLTPDEWSATYDMLQDVKAMLDEEYSPDGYNVGWNCGSVGGQNVFHSHLHVIPRFADEPLAGKGIRYYLKQPSNRRPQL